MMNSNEIKVSVIIPTYNRVERLVDAIQSVQNSTETNIEILVCDDGSTDETERTVKGLEKNDSRIKFICCGHNGRPAIPRNMGIKEAKGEWLAFLDDDDIWTNEKLSKQLDALRKRNEKACCTNAFICTNEGITSRLFFKSESSRNIKLREIFRHNPVICSSMLFHKSLVRECIGFPEDKELTAIEDYALWHRIAGYTDIFFLNEPLVGYLETSQSSIREKKKLNFNEQKRLVERNLNIWLSDKGKQKIRYFISKVFSLLDLIEYRIKRFCINHIQVKGELNDDNNT